MATTLFEVTEGWTDELGPFTLKIDGVAINLSGLTVTIVLRNTAGALVVVGGTIRVGLPTSLGQVYYTPVAADFVSGDDNEYHVHFQATNISGAKVFFPNGEPYRIVVWPA